MLDQTARKNAWSIIYKSGFSDGKIPEEVLGRMLGAAEMLPKEEYLGWQTQVDPDGNCRGYVFPASEKGATVEDFQWIFHGCADVIDASGNEIAGLFENQRRVFLLQSVEPDRNGRGSYRSWNNVYIKEKPQPAAQWEMADLMSESGMIIGMFFAPASDGQVRVRIYVSVTGELTLRMRTVFSMLFPKTCLVELQEDSDLTEDFSGLLAKEMVLESLTRFLYTLMRRQKEYCEKQEDLKLAQEFDEVVEEIDLDEEGESEKEDGNARKGTPFTSIEQLELSVRSFNCLMRAGIDSVEKLRRMKEDDLMKVRNLGMKCTHEVLSALAEFDRHHKNDVQAQLEEKAEKVDYFAMLDDLVGLKNVKDQVQRIAAFARMKKDMEKAFPGKDTSVVLNMTFAGNPGTAKTTVARILSGILYEVGILQYAQVEEVGRADLVAKYEGQTADKVKAVFQRAKGKLLFIDEAYSLLEGFDGSFGDEAINTIVQEMENNRKDTVVVFAGYPKEMKEFILRNPGLRSRVPFWIDFKDYSAEEMVEIAVREASGRGFTVEPQATGKLLSICGAVAYGEHTGNGRFCRNLVEQAILDYAVRVYGDDRQEEQKGDAFVLKAEDFVMPDDTFNDDGRKCVGF